MAVQINSAPDGVNTATYAIDANGNVTGLVTPNGSIISVSGTYTWANLIARTGVSAGSTAVVQDFNYAQFWYDGVRWRPQYKTPLLGGGPPFVMQGGGTVGASFALTLTTPLPITFTGGCYMYFLTNGIRTVGTGGNTAGWYWVVMSSTTAGTVYNYQYTGGQPVVPTSPPVFTGTNAGAYVQQVGSSIVGPYFSVPGGALGIVGGLEFEYLGYGVTNSVFQMGYGTPIYGANSLTLAGANSLRLSAKIRNMGVTGQQLGKNDFDSTSGYGQFGALPTITTNDSTVAQQAQFITYIAASATDYSIMAQYNLDLLP